MTLARPMFPPRGKTPQRRVDHHLQELTKPLREMYPGAPLIGQVRDFEAWQGFYSSSDIIATVRVEGSIEYAADRS